jgi:hypothetical protein
MTTTLMLLLLLMVVVMPLLFLLLLFLLLPLLLFALLIIFAVTEIEAVRQADSRVKAVSTDPSGAHTLVTVKTPNNYELLYLHSSWPKMRAVTKLKGLAVTAVGWQKQPSAGNADELLHSTG